MTKHDGWFSDNPPAALSLLSSCESFFKWLNTVVKGQNTEMCFHMCVWINIDVCVLSHLVASAHRELSVKGSPAAVAQVNTPLELVSDYMHSLCAVIPAGASVITLKCCACDGVRLDGVFVSSGPTVSVQRRPLGSGQRHEDSGHHAGGENVNFCLLIS